MLFRILRLVLCLILVRLFFAIVQFIYFFIFWILFNLSLFLLFLYLRLFILRIVFLLHFFILCFWLCVGVSNYMYLLQLLLYLHLIDNILILEISLMLIPHLFIITRCIFRNQSWIRNILASLASTFPIPLLFVPLVMFLSAYNTLAVSLI